MGREEARYVRCRWVGGGFSLVRSEGGGGKSCIPLAPDLWWHAGHRHVSEDTTLKKLHNVERRSNDVAVFT